MLDDILITSKHKEVLSKCAASTAYFSKTLFENDFYAPFNELHKPILDCLDCKREGNKKKKLIIAPRGAGKSTIIKSHIVKELLFSGIVNNKQLFVVYMASTADLAITQTECIKSMVLDQNVTNIFGNQKIKEADDALTNFSKKSWVTSSGGIIIPRGCQQATRGLSYRVSGKIVRPNFLVADDVEDRLKMQSQAYREATRKWFMSDVMELVSKYDDDWTIVFIGTVSHEDSLLMHFLHSDEWEVVFLKACDDDFNPTAKSYMTKEQLKCKYDELVAIGEEDAFYTEYIGETQSKKNKIFKPEYFRYYMESAGWLNAVEMTSNDKMSKPIHSSDLISIVLVDPAKEVKQHSKESAAVLIGYHKQTGQIFVRDYRSDRYKPDEFINAIISLAEIGKADVIGLEVTSLHLWITQPLMAEMGRRGVFTQIIQLNARGKKEDRIKSLASYYRYGFIYHNILVKDKLEEQLKAFPTGVLVDIIDAFGYLPALLKTLEIYPNTDESISGNVREELIDETYFDRHTTFAKEYYQWQ